jgi:4-amino-4-deoxy-L-arabinose transferase-like glycosyltransferase
MSAFLKKNGLLLIVVIAVLYFPIFWQLPKSPLSIWDEARVGVSALEINGFRTAVVPHYEGSPDMFSLKPALLPFLQRVCMEIVGYNVLGVRLPSALATFGICLLFLGFCYKRYGSLWPGIISSLVISTTPGFIRDHIALTGDYDALLAFFMTAYSIFYFSFTENPERKTNLYLAGIALILGVLTKGIAALIPLPGLLIYTLLTKKQSLLFRNKHFYFLILIFILVVGAVYGLREYYTPGYLKLVFEGELLTVPTVPVAEHSGPWWYYIDVTLWTGFGYFTAWFLLGIISGFAWPSRDRIFAFLLAYLACFFIILSISATKTPWYDAPFYPLAALAAGIFIYKVLVYFSARVDAESGSNMAFMSLCVVILFAIPYQNILRARFNVLPSDWDMLKYQPYMEKMKRDRPNLTYTVLGRDYNPQLLFFAEAYAKSGMAVTHKNIRDSLLPGETVLCCERGAVDNLKKTYRFTTIHEADPCVLVKIIGPIDSSGIAPVLTH